MCSQMSHSGSDERADIAGGRIQRKTLGSQKFILKTPKWWIKTNLPLLIKKISLEIYAST